MFKKLSNIQVNFALMAFIAFMVKVMVLEASFADSIILGVLATLYGYTHYLKRFQPYNLDEAVQKDLQEVKAALSKLNFAQSRENLDKRKYF